MTRGTHLMCRFHLALCLPLLAIFSPFVVANFLVQTPGTTWRDKPATPERMNERIEGAADKYKAYAPIPRVVFYDIGYPRNNEELAALDGHAVLLITALSQERDELPLKRVYVSLEGQETNLTSLKSVLSEDVNSDGQPAKTFGRFRADELYLLPAYLRLKPADLLVDFARNKVGLKAASFGSAVSPEVAKLVIRPPAGRGPAVDALDVFIKREFPGFFAQ
jgi:hypothetical protein